MKRVPRQSITVDDLGGVDYKTYVSQNKVSYWITHSFLDVCRFEITLFKDTEEGKTFERILESKNLNYIKDWLDLTIIKYTKITDIIKLMKMVKKESIEMGKEMLREDIRKSVKDLLGIN